MTSERSTPTWAKDARDLYLVAMAVFLVTIVIGILNGADVVEFNRDQILTHVHSGTVGWLTLTIVATSFLLFRASDRRLMVTLAVLVPVYVLAFYTGNFAFRAVGGTALLITIAWLLFWIWTQYLGGERSLPRLAVTLGLTSFGYGAVIGVIMQIGFALEVKILPGDNIGAHASAMTFGYLVLTAMGLIEWRILGTRGLPRAGLVQVSALFLGGLVISLGLLFGVEQAAGGIYLLSQIVAAALFVVRVWPRALGRSWTAADPVRHLAIASLWTVIALVIFMYIVLTFITAADPEASLPFNLLIASDHAVYIGVITNIMLGVLSLLVLRGASAWMGQVIFWGVNLGLVVFVIGLVLDTAEVKRLGAPVMGITLLLALALLAWRTLSSEPDTAGLEAV